MTVHIYAYIMLVLYSNQWLMSGFHLKALATIWRDSFMFHNSKCVSLEIFEVYKRGTILPKPSLHLEIILPSHGRIS